MTLTFQGSWLPFSLPLPHYDNKTSLRVKNTNYYREKLYQHSLFIFCLIIIYKTVPYNSYLLFCFATLFSILLSILSLFDPSSLIIYILSFSCIYLDFRTPPNPLIISQAVVFAFSPPLFMIIHSWLFMLGHIIGLLGYCKCGTS